MRINYRENWPIYLWLLLTAALISPLVAQLLIDGHCKSLGWTKGELAVSGGYCLARTEQTDVIVPWREAPRR